MPGKIKKILVANRGEIACRIFRTCRKLGISTVAVYSEADAHALHVRQADESICIGPGPSSESYLVIDRILAAVAQSGADAVHPGYGFLSENSAFAEALEAREVTFIGPSSDSMRKLGDKIASKQLALKHKVPTAATQFLTSATQSEKTKVIRAFAKKNGLPLLIKASAGGGGRGMREVTDLNLAMDALDSAQREAQSAFGNPEVFLEKIIRPARHIEVQIAGDSKGVVVALGDRDCTWQRRNQKIIEEAPAPNLSTKLRRAIHAAACRLAKAARYQNLGTVEFLLDTKNSFYFLEVNSRLQVEHPVTEFTTGMDLVELQVRLAEGFSLATCGVRTTKKPSCHAIEARLCAETERNGFAQISTGKISHFEIGPSRQTLSMRVDRGFETGDVIPHFYDSLIAKVIVSAKTRSSAIDSLAEAIELIHVEGVSTNSSVIQQLLQSNSFRAVTHAIDLYSRLPDMTMRILEQRAFVAALLSLYEWTAASTFNPTLRSGLLPKSRRFPAIDGVPFEVGVVRNEHGIVCASVMSGTTELNDRKEWSWQFVKCSIVELDTARYSMQYTEVNSKFQKKIELFDAGMSGWIHGLGTTFKFEKLSAISPGTATTSSGEIKSPLPGRIVKVAVTKGARVEAGDPLVTLESMKMEHSVKAHATGHVGEIFVGSGDTVDAGSLLMRVVYTPAR